ncbi:MAG: hypothetical protein GY874_10925 [Desulfobacteraceae bacterium]|nr:hypothetical protein [Desulfobacteraceae bacterium]
MKKIILLTAILSLSCLISGLAFAGEFEGEHYTGKIKRIWVGYYGQTGIALDDATCNGESYAMLLNDHYKYKENLTMLLTAQMTGQEVTLVRLDYPAAYWGGGQIFCTVHEVILGSP